MKQEITIYPVHGARAHFKIKAESALRTGQCLVLARRSGRFQRRLLAMVETSTFETLEAARTHTALPDVFGPTMRPAWLAETGTKQKEDREMVVWEEYLTGTLTVLGEIDNDSRVKKLHRVELEPGTMLAVDAEKEVLTDYFGTVEPKEDSEGVEFTAPLVVGGLLLNPGVHVALNAVGFNRHTALLAQSGSGKSNALGVILEELVARTTARILVIDPNGDFNLINELSEEGELDQQFKVKFKLQKEKIAVISDPKLTTHKEMAGGIARQAQRAPRIAILDFSSLDPLVWSKAAEDVLDFIWEFRDAKKAIIIAIDEAHNFAPDTERTENKSLLDLLIRIAGEGRKYGLWLILASQRPQKLHPNIITQCDNLILMRLISRSDVNHIAGAFSYASPEMIELSYGFDIGEGLTVGRIVRAPTLLKFRKRYTREGGGDIPNDWAKPT